MVKICIDYMTLYDYIDQICIDSVDSVCMILIFVRKRTNVWRF